MWGAPVYGSAQEVDGRWRIIRLNADSPQDARDSLASHFRRLHSETPPTADNAAERAEYESIYELLDWEAIDEMTVNGVRYRIIRAQTFIRMGADGPEPPRPTDPDPHQPGQTKRDSSQLDGFVIDPAASTGLTDGRVRMEMVSASYPPTHSRQAHDDSRRAMYTHPNVVLLPVGFTIGQYVDRSWRPKTSMGVRDSAGRQGRRVLLDAGPAAGDPVRGVHDRVRTRPRCAPAATPTSSRWMVSGAGSPGWRPSSGSAPTARRGPRPSDPDSHLPPARLMAEERAKGLVIDED